VAALVDANGRNSKSIPLTARPSRVISHAADKLFLDSDKSSLGSLDPFNIVDSVRIQVIKHLVVRFADVFGVPPIRSYEAFWESRLLSFKGNITGAHDGLADIVLRKCEVSRAALPNVGLIHEFPKGKLVCADMNLQSNAQDAMATLVGFLM
jgi:hypothetical protein